jgi:hypothetical protein
MFKWLVFLLSVSLCLSLAAQTIPKDFKPQENKDQHTINKDISKRDGQSFNNLSHPLSITGGGLILTGAALYIIGAESKKNEPITNRFSENYSPDNTLQYIGLGAFAAGAVLFTIFSTDRKAKAPKRKTKKSYDASEWEVETE